MRMNSRISNGQPSGRFCRISRGELPVLTTDASWTASLGPALRRTLARPAALLWSRTTCYNRFVRWRQAGVWDRMMDALAAGHDAAVARKSDGRATIARKRQEKVRR
jgi:hypothetical protein